MPLSGTAASLFFGRTRTIRPVRGREQSEIAGMRGSDRMMGIQRSNVTPGREYEGLHNGIPNARSRSLGRLHTAEMTSVRHPQAAHSRSQARLSFSERSRSRSSTKERSRSVTSRLSRSHSRAPLRGSISSSPSSVKRDWKVSRDVRTRLPPILRRFSGYRDPQLQPPFPPISFPPFSWLCHVSLKHETWLLSFIGSLVSIGLIEIVMSASFPNHDTVLIVASFGASAVLLFSTIESPLAQPRHLLGGQILSAVLGVGLNRLFRMADNYRLGDTIGHNELGHVVWINGALAMSLSLLLMQVTGTVHPP